ncbi:cytochrome c biogenesis CcdA family protein [Vulgatibacter incomptus]|uniref:Cytochrome c-type biogenesis protein CcdA n=1 Tax=Vulgatibacter incomptus TaxID=1391653 RepID=A0A0K1PE49_9BACT|nr:cytochrome c biogenesis CcdA family protein [Vulgatibacter incomptus]AKU91785.1 Cytochrome c-type biogenesis protein CcdA [Vulgatibacter incomptus]
MTSISLPAAVFAGALSFLSPCVFPLVPGYLSFLTGSSAGDAEGARGKAIGRAAAFSLGFGLVFVALGATASTFGQLLGEHRRWLDLAGGALVILFGLHLLGILRVSLFFREARFQKLPSPKGFFGALLVGLAFGFGWSPCVGPLLGGVLTLAAADGTIGHGVLLLSGYAVGLAIPFIVSAAALQRFLAASSRIRPWLPWVERTGGALLTAFGVLLVTGKMGVVMQFLPGFESLAL